MTGGPMSDLAPIQALIDSTSTLVRGACLTGADIAPHVVAAYAARAIAAASTALLFAAILITMTAILVRNSAKDGFNSEGKVVAIVVLMAASIAVSVITALSIPGAIMALSDPAGATILGLLGR